MNTKKQVRSLRIAQKIQVNLNTIFNDELQNIDPVLFSYRVYVQEVQMRQDLNVARCFVANLQGVDLVTTRLNRCTKKIRFLLAKRLNMKFIPEIKFIQHTSIIQDVYTILDSLKMS